jgi:TonB family protein
LALVLLLVSSPAWCQQFLIIVHPDNPVSMMTSDQVSKLFLKTDTQWGGGATVEPVDLPVDSPTRLEFSLEVHGRTAENIQSYWQKQIFSGRAVPPVEVSSDNEVLSYVREHPSAIGYVSAGVDLTGLKVLSVTMPPQRLSAVPARYTERARRFRVEGTVTLEIEVDTNGDVGDIKVLEGLPHGLTQEAERAVKQWKYRPASRDGRPVASTVKVHVRFTL